VLIAGWLGLLVCYKKEEEANINRPQELQPYLSSLHLLHAKPLKKSHLTFQLHK
jgi:hypothetical protein